MQELASCFVDTVVPLRDWHFKKNKTSQLFGGLVVSVDQTLTYHKYNFAAAFNFLIFFFNEKTSTINYMVTNTL